MGIRKRLFPTWEWQQEKMRREEAERQANFARQQKILDHKLASLGRQTKLAEKHKKIARLDKKLHPQQTFGYGLSFETPNLGLPGLDFEKPRRRRR